ncbi:MAG: glucose-6-phosphate isomerase [Thiotrichaceae bacterium]
MKPPINHSPIWQQLKTHQQSLAKIQMRQLFAEDKQRFQRFSLQNCGLLLDYSKHLITQETINLLTVLAREAQLAEWTQRMYQGDKINHTENRAALHIALRNRNNQPIQVDGKDVMPEVNAVLDKMRRFTTSVRNGDWKGHTGKPIDTIVNIGIGGSDLGPAMVTRALKAYHHPNLHSYFISNVDATHWTEISVKLNPETTLFIVASKTFTTQETMLNANSARAWFLAKTGDEAAIAKHFVAVSTAQDKVVEFGIDPQQMFEFWDWVGGRYSLWSAIGLSSAVMIGMDNFESLLAGAYEMDQHFLTAPFEQNMPVLLGLIDVWYSNFFGEETRAVLPYDFSLELFPAYLQQLVMESLGKHVNRDGQAVEYTTCPIIWGAPGNNGQHAFYQLLHQGTHLVPCDFIIAIESQHSLPNHQDAVLSNALAQAHSLMMGRTEAETEAALRQTGLSAAGLEVQLPHRVYRGNQPSNTIMYQKLTPNILGALITLYERKAFVQSVIWNINPFDQWGVELWARKWRVSCCQNCNVLN